MREVRDSIFILRCHKSAALMKRNGKCYRVIYRDARTGQLVTEEYARRFPQYTVRETVQIPC